MVSNRILKQRLAAETARLRVTQEVSTGAAGATTKVPESLHWAHTRFLKKGEDNLRKHEFESFTNQLTPNTPIRITTKSGAILSEGKLIAMEFKPRLYTNRGYISIRILEKDKTEPEDITTLSSDLKIHWN